MATVDDGDVRERLRAYIGATLTDDMDFGLYVEAQDLLERLTEQSDETMVERLCPVRKR